VIGLEFADSTSALVPSIIGAIGAMVAAALIAWVAWRSSSASTIAERIVERITERIEDLADQSFRDFKAELREILDSRTRGIYFSDIVRRALREVMREQYGRPGGRRTYDPDNGDD
jgi:dsRNA-specific ribonuclease